VITRSDCLTGVPSLAQTVRAWREDGCSQPAIASELNIDRREVMHIIDQTA
jgi:hypothetical protein